MFICHSCFQKDQAPLVFCPWDIKIQLLQGFQQSSPRLTLSERIFLCSFEKHRYDEATNCLKLIKKNQITDKWSSFA